MSEEANKITKQLLSASKIQTERIVSKEDMDDLYGRIATALDQSWATGFRDAKNEELLNRVREQAARKDGQR